MAKVRIRNKEFNVSEVSRITHHSKHETLLFLGPPKLEKGNKTFCLGVGLVRTIQKGKEFDLVGMDFGRGYPREIYVKNNHARRQIYTLKRGQIAWFYGFMSVYKTPDNRTLTSFFAKGFQGWYVPKNMDIVNIDTTEIEELAQESESKINFIDELLKGEE